MKANLWCKSYLTDVMCEIRYEIDMENLEIDSDNNDCHLKEVKY